MAPGEKDVDNPALDPLISRIVSHGIVPSRSLSMKKSALLNTRDIILSYGFVPSLQDPELHILMVIATKTAPEPHNLMCSSLLASMRSSQNTRPHQLAYVRKLSSLQSKNLDCFPAVLLL